MRELRATFDNDDFEKLKEAKGERSWREAILEEFEFVCPQCGDRFKSVSRHQSNPNSNCEPENND